MAETGYNFTLPMVLHLKLQDQWDIRTTGRGVAEIEAGEMNIEVLAFKGEQGDPGRDGKPVQVHRAQISSDIPDIEDLDSTWVGHAWRLDDSRDVKVVVESFPGGPVKFETIPNFLGARGDAGPAPTFSVASGTSTSTGDGAVQVTERSPGAYELDFVLPRGAAGAPSTVPGPAAAIEAATDYDDGGVDAVIGQVLTRTADGWGPADLPASSPAIYEKLGTAADFEAVNSGNAWTGEYKLITPMPLPVLPFAYEPEVFAMVEFFTTANLRIDLEARLGSVSGPLLGRGPGAAISAFQNQWVPRQLMPAADAAATLVPANTSVTLYLIAKKIDTLAATRLETRKDRAYVRVRAMPAAI